MLIPELAAVLDDDLGEQADTFGPALAVPLRSAADISGVLLAVRDKGAAPFEPEQVPVLASFADQAALALEAAQTQRAHQLLELLAGRDRIARDLHDHVIQRLYASGMSLQGMLRLVNGHDARGRIQQVVDQLDDTIRDIRTTIFDLHPKRWSGKRSATRSATPTPTPAPSRSPSKRVTTWSSRWSITESASLREWPAAAWPTWNSGQRPATAPSPSSRSLVVPG